MVENTSTIPFISLQPACLIALDPQKCETVINVRRAVGAFSLVGCLFMISVIWLFRKYLAFTQRMILYLSIGAMMDSIAYIMSSTIEDGPWCDFQALWLTYFDWTVLLWVSALTFDIFMKVILNKTTEEYEKLYHVVCWGTPILLSLLPFIGNHYGPAGAWCWITNDIGWRLGIWYAPLFIIIFLMFFVYIYIAVTIRKRVSTWEGTYDPEVERNHLALKEEVKPLQFYPFVYLAISVFPLINRINNAINPHSDAYWMVLMASISAPLHGFCNAIVFGLDKETLKKLKPSQLKLAITARLAPRAQLQEYPTPDDDIQILGDNDILQQAQLSEDTSWTRHSSGSSPSW